MTLMDVRLAFHFHSSRHSFNHSDKQKNGIYMLRQSARDENKFVLSLVKDGQCYHYRAHHMGNGTFLDEKTDSVFYCKCFSNGFSRVNILSFSFG